MWRRFLHPVDLWSFKRRRLFLSTSKLILSGLSVLILEKILVKTFVRSLVIFPLMNLVFLNIHYHISPFMLPGGGGGVGSLLGGGQAQLIQLLNSKSGDPMNSSVFISNVSAKYRISLNSGKLNNYDNLPFIYMDRK